MFKEHQPLISSWAKESKANIMDVIMFASLSIRQPFPSVKNAMENYRKLQGRSKHLWGYKLKTHKYINSTANVNNIICGIFSPSNITRIKELTNIPGINIVKAGFIVQMIHGEVGCLDSINAKKYNLTKLNYRKPVEEDDIINYIKLCQSLGGSELLWDEWCKNQQIKYSNTWSSPHEVSYYHYKVLSGGQ